MTKQSLKKNKTFSSLWLHVGFINKYMRTIIYHIWILCSDVDILYGYRQSFFGGGIAIILFLIFCRICTPLQMWMVRINLARVQKVNICTNDCCKAKAHTLFQTVFLLLNPRDDSGIAKDIHELVVMETSSTCCSNIFLARSSQSKESGLKWRRNKANNSHSRQMMNSGAAPGPHTG